MSKEIYLLERDVKKHLKDYLVEIEAYQFWPVQTGYGKRTLDCLLCYKGRFFAIETKREGIHKPTAFQEHIITDIACAGGLAWVENDPQLELTREILSSL